MRGREAPKGESAAALRLRAYRQKLAMRAFRAAQLRAAGKLPQGPQTTSWVGLGPAPLASDATGNGGQDYNWVSGRATSVLADPADTTGNTVLLGGAYGGLWRSSNAGNLNANPANVVWQPLIDEEPSLAVGAIAVQPNSGVGGISQVILVGTGETNSSGDSYYGMGILRSADGGSTWSQITTAQSGQSFVGVGFSKIAFSTANTNLVVASTAGDIGYDFGLEQDGNSTARGIYYSTDAGVTWNRVTLSDGAVAASVTGVVYNSGANAFFAAIRRHGIYSSTDGQHFSRLATQPAPDLVSANCPANQNASSCPIYRAEFAVTPGRNEMYTWIVSVNGNGEYDDGVWKTTNAGSSWTQVADNGITNCGNGGGGETPGTDAGSGCGVSQGVYNLEIAAVPNGSGTDLYAGAVNLFKCNLASGSSSCSTIDPNVPNDWVNLTHVYGCNPLGENAHVHPDQHGLGFMVVSGKAQGYFGHDGGISRTQDGFTGLNSGTCTTSNQFDSLSQTLGSMTEFVSFSVHPASADIMLGGTQDNGSPKTATATSSTTWQNALGGDGGYNAINPNPAPAGAGGDGIAGDEWFLSNPGSVIGVCEAGTACDDNNAFLEAIPGYPVNGNIDQGPFYTNFILDPQNTGEMLIGTCRIWRGDTPTGTFSQISQNFDTGDTTLCNGFETNQVHGLAAGGPKDQNSFSTVVYATTDGFGPFNPQGGEVWETTAVSTTMTNVTGNINPNHYSISSVAMDKSDATGKTAYVGIMGFHVPHVFKTANAGSSWTDWTGSGNTALPDAPISALLVDSAAGVIYAGTDVGVFSSPTTGNAGVWTEVGPVAGPGAAGFLPSAPVTAIQIFNPNQNTKKLRVSTYGRGIWEWNLIAQPDFSNTISNSPQTVFPSTNAVFNGTLTAQNGYNKTVTLSCTGTPPSTCTPNPTQLIPVSTGSAYTITAAGAIGDYNFNAHATDGAISHDAAITLHVVDFALGSPNPGTVDVPEGFTGTTTFQVTAQGSFSQSVTLSCSSGLPSGATCSFSPSATVSPTASNPVTVTLTVSAAGNPPQGTSTVTIQGATMNPTGTRTTTFQLVVQAAPTFTWLTTGATSHTVLAGQQTLNYGFRATPTSQSTFLGNVTLSCSFSPSDPTLSNSNCNFTPSSIPAGSGATAVTLSITTVGPNQGTGTNKPQFVRQSEKRSPLLPFVLPIAGLLCVGFAGRRMSKHSAILGLLVSLVLLGFLVACGGGGGGNNTPPPVAVAINPSAAVNLYANEVGNQWPAPQTQQYTATVTNSSNTAVSWTLSQNGTDCTANPACGTLSSNSGSPVTYTAPTTVPNPAGVTVKATSQADTTKSASDTVNVLQPTAVGTFTVTVTATEGSVSNHQQVTMTVQ